MDETTDIMSTSQLSTILQYIYIYMTNEGVEERFLRFVNVNHNRSVHCLAECFFIYYMNYLQTLLFANKNI